MKKRKEYSKEKKMFLLWLSAAAAMHILLLSGLFFLDVFNQAKQRVPKIINVSLVSLPGAGSSSASQAEGPGRAETVEKKTVETPPVAPRPEPQAKPKESAAIPAPVKKPEKEISEAPAKPKALPVANPKPAQLDKALDRLKLEVNRKTSAPPSRADQLSSALAKLQDKVRSQPARGAGSNDREAVSSAGGVGGTGKGASGGGISDPYGLRIAQIINKNWEFSLPRLKNSDGLEVYVRINILPDGTIHEIRFDKRASSEYLNNSVKKALEKSSPLLALPKKYGGSLWIGFVFTPEGITL
ncbi:MAG: cell envelope integrity protein TolA [Chlorobiaceae bacterium]|nr:cell envelope integrity protein TolA [Chlorobiaceae bacterium]